MFWKTRHFRRFKLTRKCLISALFCPVLPYSPIPDNITVASHSLVEMVRAAGVEPTTFGFGDRRSIQLSYARSPATIPVRTP